MSQKLNTAIAVIGIDIGKNSFHVVGLDDRSGNRAAAEMVTGPGGNTARQHAALPDRDGGLRRGTSSHISRKLKGLSHDARLMPAKYVRPYSKGQKNDFRDAEAIAEAVQRPTMKFVA